MKIRFVIPYANSKLADMIGDMYRAQRIRKMCQPRSWNMAQVCMWVFKQTEQAAFQAALQKPEPEPFIKPNWVTGQLADAHKNAKVNHCVKSFHHAAAGTTARSTTRSCQTILLSITSACGSWKAIKN